jgi:hypothetical protein
MILIFSHFYFCQKPTKNRIEYQFSLQSVYLSVRAGWFLKSYKRQHLKSRFASIKSINREFEKRKFTTHINAFSFSTQLFSAKAAELTNGRRFVPFQPCRDVCLSITDESSLRGNRQWPRPAIYYILSPSADDYQKMRWVYYIFYVWMHLESTHNTEQIVCVWRAIIVDSSLLGANHTYITLLLAKVNLSPFIPLLPLCAVGKRGVKFPIRRSKGGGDF